MEDNRMVNEPTSPPPDEVIQALEKVLDLSVSSRIPPDGQLLEEVKAWKKEDPRYRNHVSEWKGYLGETIMATWESLTPRERAIRFVVCEIQAANEEWD